MFLVIIFVILLLAILFWAWKVMTSFFEEFVEAMLSKNWSKIISYIISGLIVYYIYLLYKN